jgi:hypothetical protein
MQGLVTVMQGLVTVMQGLVTVMQGLITLMQGLVTVMQGLITLMQGLITLMQGLITVMQDLITVMQDLITVMQDLITVMQDFLLKKLLQMIPLIKSTCARAFEIEEFAFVLGSSYFYNVLGVQRLAIRLRRIANLTLLIMIITSTAVAYVCDRGVKF